MAQNYRTNNDSCSNTPQFQPPHLVQQQELYNLHIAESLYPARDNLPPSESAYLNQDSPSRSPTLSSPPTSASATGIPANWPSHPQQQQSHHLTSTWREGYSTRNRRLQQQAYQQRDFLPTQSHHRERVKRENMSHKNEDKSTVGAGASTVASTSATTSAPRDDPMPSTSDFVKKLYKMLEDPSFQSVVCWGPLGDCFVVKDMNEFTKSILPRMFKHSNFASFVRQLNKYDFHKVKNMDDNQFGEHSWTFRHPDFHADRRDALENIKRKVPAQRKTALAAAALAAAAQQTAGGTTSSGSLPSNNSTSNANSSSSLPYAPNSHSGSGSQSYQQSSSNPSGGSFPAVGGGVGGRSPSPTRAHLTAEIQRLKDEGEDLRGRIRVLERNYENVLVEMLGFQRGMAQQDGLMQSLIAYFLGSENGKTKNSTSSSSSATAPNPDFTPSSSLPTRTHGSPPRPIIHVPTEQTSPATQSSTTSTTSPPSAKSLAYQQLKQQIYAHLAAREASAGQPFSGGLGIGLGLGGLAAAATAAPYAQTPPAQAQAQIQRTGMGMPTTSSTLSASLSDQNPFLQGNAVQRMLDTTSLSSLSATGASASAGLSGPGSGYYLDQGEVSQPSAPGPQDLGRATLMQMSELSRRAAAAAAAGVPLPTSFSALYGGGDSQGRQQPQQPQQPQDGQQKLSRADVLAQIKEFHRGWSSQGGWAGVAATSGSHLAQLLPTSQQQGQSSNWDARGRSLSRSGGFGEERGRHQERQRQRALSMQMDDVDVEMDTRGRSQAQRSHRRRQSDGAAFLGGDRMRVGAAGGDRGGDDDGDKSPEEYVMPIRQNVGDQPPSSSALRQQQPIGITPFSGDNPWATMFNFGSSSFPPDATDAFNNIPMNPTDEHEGLQVYTVGHLLPRNNGGDDTQGSWTFDASGLATGGMFGGLGIGGVGGASSVSPNASEQTYSQGLEEETVQPTPSNVLIPAGSSSTSSSGSSSAVSGGASGQKLRVRRSTFVPGWAVPPRVLLVDDDAVSRQLSSKFLKVFGCTTDVAVDGVAAVNKMNLEKYDLVLMDIVMPKLDGVSATNLIRKFDQGTPIISMTSNSKPNEIMTYYSSGMNDILPKPFTKEGLLDMLEKHLMHLKVIQQQMNMSKLGLNALGSIPKNVGALPPLSDTNFEHAITNSALALMAESGVDPNSNGEDSSSSSNSGTIVASSSTPRPLSPFNFNFGLPYFPSAQQPSEEDEGRINPLAGMGLTDEQYNLILQNIVSGDGFLDGMDNLMSSASSSTSGSGLGSGSGYAGGNGSGFLGSEATTPTPTMGMYAGDGMMMGGEKRGLEEEGEGQRDGKMKRGRYNVG